MNPQALLVAITSTILATACVTPSPAQSAEGNQSDCVSAPIFTRSNLGSDYYTNTCKMTVGVSLIFPRGGLFAFDLKPSQRDGSGHSKSDYESMGEPKVFVCAQGLRPIDDETGKRVTLYTNRYTCKH